MTAEPKTPTAIPMRSRSWENTVPHIDLGESVGDEVFAFQ